MWHVYRGINYAVGEVYFGVSQDPSGRRDGSHCVGGTKAVAHWNCETDRMRWEVISSHRSQGVASAHAHAWERKYEHPQGFHVIRTAGV